MRKTLLSVMMLGALTVATTSLTSCKDYDDDINNLQEQIASLKTTLGEIQQKIDKGYLLTSVTDDGNGGVNLTLSDGSKYNIKKGDKGETGASGKDGKNATIWTISEDGYWCYQEDGKDVVKTTYKAVGTDGKNGTNGTNGTNGKDGKYYVPNAETGTFWVYNDGDKAPYDSKISYVSANVVTAAWEKDVLTLSNVSGATDGIVKINLTTVLKSLVFNPDFYYQGIEALDMSTFKYNPYTVKKVDANGDYSKDAPTAATSTFTYSPDMAATYFLNPANAKMVSDAAQYSFLAYNKKYTRADEPMNFNVESADLSKDGQVTVHAKYNGPDMKNISTDDQVTVIALQYKDPENNEKVITSDFAAVTQSTYTDLALNLATATTNNHVEGDAHLYSTAAKAIKADAQAKVAWNGSIDLRTLVNTDRKYEGSCKGWDKNATEDIVNKAGFKYSFELVGYTDGENKTSQSAHAAIAKDGYTLRPQMTKDGKQQAYGAEQNKATIDREPLVRVILTDTVNNKIAAVGYVKIKIAPTEDAEKQETYELNTQTDPYTIACGDDNVLNKKFTWDEIEEGIIAKLNMSKTDFEDKYALDGEKTDANQFSENTLNATPSERIGTVSETTTDVNGKQTQVLEWVVYNQQAYNAFANGKTTLTTYVRFALKPGKTAPNKYVYVKLTWTPSAVNVSPTTSLANVNKIKSYWYAANAATEGYSDIHGNVEVVGTTDNGKNGCTTAAADDEYIFSILNTFEGHKLNLTMAAPYNNLVVTPKFCFENYNGLVASENGAELYKDASMKDLVASMDQKNGIVKFADTEAAKDLLNAYGPTNLEKTLTAKIAVKCTICGTIDVPVSNNTFFVKFLRPISVTDASVNFGENETLGSEKAIAMTFKDWRGHDFTDTKVTKGQDYFKYYGVKAIKLELDKAKTDINGNETQLLSVVAPNVKLSYTAATTVGSGDAPYGKLKYQNNGSTLRQFHVYIPATVTYDWGTVHFTVKATIGTTVTGAKKH